MNYYDQLTLLSTFTFLVKCLLTVLLSGIFYRFSYMRIIVDDHLIKEVVLFQWLPL